MNSLRQPTSPVWFFGPLIGVYAAASAIIGVLPRIASPDAVAAGLAIDLVVLVPALYYWVMIRGRGWPAITLAPVVLLSFGAASLLLPSQYRAVLGSIGLALPAIEVGLVAYIGYRAFRLVRSRTSEKVDADFYRRIRRTLQGAFGAPAFAGALAYEASLFHYAFSIRTVAPAEEGFTYHRRSGYGAVLGALFMAAALELVGVHLLLRTWSEVAVWIHIALSAYGVVWLLGDYRAMRRRPHEVRSEGLILRCGLRWEIEAGWDQVERVRRSRGSVTETSYLSAVPIGDPRYILEFSRPVEAVGPYGILREVRSVGITIDNASEFEERLKNLGVRIES